jgi:hypothetical protein
MKTLFFINLRTLKAVRCTDSLIHMKGMNLHLTNKGSNPSLDAFFEDIANIIIFPAAKILSNGNLKAKLQELTIMKTFA